MIVCLLLTLGDHLPAACEAPVYRGIIEFEGLSGKTGQASGTLLYQALFERFEQQGYRFKLHCYDAIKQISRDFNAGQIDALFPYVMRPKETRALESTAMMRLEYVAFVRQGRPEINTIENFKSKEVGVVLGAYLPPQLTTAPSIQLVTVYTTAHLFGMLSRGRIDIVIMERQLGSIPLNSSASITHTLPAGHRPLTWASDSIQACKASPCLRTSTARFKQC
ncbi:MAG: hypothetical protein V7629_11715 [Motiliproteus sp.]